MRVKEIAHGITRAQAADIDRIPKLPNVNVAVGHKVELNNFDRWLTEIDKIVDEAHVLYVHTKYMLIDPLGPMPIVVVGSANISKASTDTNDENMLVIRGNSAVADFGALQTLRPDGAERSSAKTAGRAGACEQLTLSILHRGGSPGESIS